MLRFYIILFLLFIFLFFFIGYDNLSKIIYLILLFNFVISILTQIFSYAIEKNNIDKIKENDANKSKDTSDEDKSKDFLYIDWWDCIIRCCAGILEMGFYVFAFKKELPELIVGYLVLKTLSYWREEKNNKENIEKYVLKGENGKYKIETDKEKEIEEYFSGSKKEGLHTAVLRIATVMQILFSYWI